MPFTVQFYLTDHQKEVPITETFADLVSAHKRINEVTDNGTNGIVSVINNQVVKHYTI